MFKKNKELLEGCQRDSKKLILTRPTLSSRDGKYIPKPDPIIMASKDWDTTPPTTITIINDNTQTPRFKGERGGMDVYTFLSNVDDVTAKRRLTTDKDKINVLRDLADPSNCYAQSVIMSDYFMIETFFKGLRDMVIHVFAARSKLGPVSVLFKMVENLRKVGRFPFMRPCHTGDYRLSLRVTSMQGYHS